MRRATPTRLGPANHGKLVDERELVGVEYVGGVKYEIIDGRLYVSPQDHFPENYLESWLRDHLILYTRSRPDIANMVANKGRVCLPSSIRTTVPELDLALYLLTDRNAPLTEQAWEIISPILVCEVLVNGDINKDVTRNPELYLQVPSIREYWVLNGSENPNKPSRIQDVRRGKRWLTTTHEFGSTITTKLLPGFTLTIDPRS